jgi:sugar/nucleoside kinase (ribokinase family)
LLPAVLGFIDGLLNGQTLQLVVVLGAAAGALAMSMTGATGVATFEDVL